MRLLGELIEELRKCLSQLAHKLGDFLLRCATLDSFCQFLLVLLQASLCLRQATTVFNAQCKVPELIDGAGNCLPASIISTI